LKLLLSPKVKKAFDTNRLVSGRNCTESTPLHLASEFGHLECVRILLQNRANPAAYDDSNQTPIKLTCQSADRDNYKHREAIVKALDDALKGN
jgi:ankyrin repeat protein